MEFYYAKLNFFNTLFTEFVEGNIALRGARPDVLEAAMKSGVKIISRGNTFGFSDVTNQTIDDKPYLYGKLIKYADRGEKVANEVQLTTGTVIVPHRILSESHFVIEFEENLLLYTQSKAHLNKNSFIIKFNDLINTGLARADFSCEAFPVSEQYSFFQRLSSMKEVFELELTIFPTNPYPHKTIEGIDNVLKRQNVKSKTIKYKSKPGGLKVDEKEIKDNSTYADVGYGKAEANGIGQDGKYIRISSQRSERQKSIAIESKSRNPFDILQKIKESIDEKNL